MVPVPVVGGGAGILPDLHRVQFVCGDDRLRHAHQVHVHEQFGGPGQLIGEHDRVKLRLAEGPDHLAEILTLPEPFVEKRAHERNLESGPARRRQELLLR